MDDLFHTEVYAPDALEEVRNDTLATAQLLSEGTYEIDGLGQDWFRIDSQAGFMRFVMTPGNEPLNIDMALHDSNGNRIQRDVVASGMEDFDRRLSTAGTYYLRVYAAPLGDSPPSDTPLDYTLSVDLPEVIAPDGNDTRATATALAEGTHSVVGTGVDWFRVNSPSGLINLTLDTVENLSDATDYRDDIRNLNMEIYNSTGVLVRSDFSTGTQETISYLAPEAGEYFVKVYAAQFGGNAAPDNVLLSYNLGIDLPEDVPAVADTNGTMATADPLTTGRTVVTDGTGSDWYRVETGPGMMDFTMTHAGKTTPDGAAMNLNMRLFDSDGNPVQSSFAEFTDERFSFQAPTSGTYYLNVYWAPFEGRDLPAGVVLDYALDVDLPRNTWSKELDFGPIRNASISVYDIDGDGRDEIFAGAVKALDTQANELLPGGLIVLEDNGDVKWTQTFAPFAGPDPLTGKTYNSTSVSTAPVFSDLDNDGSIDILVGVGADNRGEFSPAGQPGDLGGLYALNADGSIKWFHQSIDSFGRSADPSDPNSPSGPDGRPDGIYGAPRVFDIDADGQREVIVASWDHYLYVLDGRTGKVEFTVDLHDTAGATPALADLNNDGLFELIVPADITANPSAGLPAQGGILHVMNNYGHQTVVGWDTQVGTSIEADFRGKFDAQSLWSSPKIVDLDKNGTLEIVQGTGNFFQDARGEYVKVWNTDGTLRHQFNTEGRVLATPLIADLDGNGSSEIIAATLEGYVYAWNASGQQVFGTQVMPFDNATMTGVSDVPIARQPIAVDLTGNGNLEILVSIGSQLVVLNAAGQQITNTEVVERAFNNYAGSPVAHDVDGDGYMDLITGGSNAAQDHAVVYRWENIVDTQVGATRIAEYQNSQSLHQIETFVDRLYATILGRDADPTGRNNWVDRLYTGVLSGADVSSGFIFSPEFANRGTTDTQYVTVLYDAFFGNAPDARGLERWTGDLASGLSRADVLSGFTNSPQFNALAASFGIRAESRTGEVDSGLVLTGSLQDSDVLRAGAGNNTLTDGIAPVTTVTENGTEIAGQVYRLYGATLGRAPDANGFQSWFNGLVPGQGNTDITLNQAAGAFVNSAEFQQTYGSLSNAEFVTTLYQNVLDRAPDARGLARWTGDLDNGVSRAEVVIGFSEGQEFRNSTTPELDTWMRGVKPEWNDVLEGGAGNDQMNGGIGSDTFVFRRGQGGADVIHGFEPWDQLQLSGFGFTTAADARAQMRQSGDAVIFEEFGQTITFNKTTLADMNRVRFNVS
jgi:uncharacterized protein DUF4214/VCBS repeat protein/pre-peptidase